MKLTQEEMDDLAQKIAERVHEWPRWTVDDTSKDIMKILQEFNKAEAAWISAKDKLPDSGQRVLISYGAGPWVSAATFEYDMGNNPQFAFDGTTPGNGYAWQVTHWQPLPEPA